MKYTRIRVLTDRDNGTSYHGFFDLNKVVMYCDYNYKDPNTSKIEGKAYATFLDGNYFIFDLSVEELEKVLHDAQFNDKLNTIINEEKKQ